MNDTGELSLEAELSELEQLMKERDEQKRQSAIARAELEEMKRLESEVQAEVSKVRLEVEGLRKQRTGARMRIEESEKATRASNDTFHTANRLQNINKLVESKKRVMQAFGADKLSEFQRKARANQERVDDAPWIPEHNQLSNELRMATSEVDALKIQVDEAEAQVAHYEHELNGHSKLQFKDFLFKACELAVKEKHSHSTLCKETRLNAELKSKVKPRNSDLDTTQDEEMPPSQPTQQSRSQPRVVCDLPRGSPTSRGTAIDNHDDGMVTGGADRRLAQLGNGRVLQDTDDTLADLDITEPDVANGSSHAYQQQQEMDTSLISEADDAETAGNGNKTDDGLQKFVTPATPAASSGVDRRQDASEASTPTKQALVQPKVASRAMASSQSRNGVPDERPSSSQRNNQLSPRMRTPLASRSGTVQEGRWMQGDRPQPHSGTPSRSARNSDYDAPPRAHAHAVPSGSTDREPRTPVTTQRPSASDKPSSKPDVFRAPPPPKTLPQPKTKQQQAAVEKECSVTPHKDTPRPPEKKNAQADSTSTNSNVAPAPVEGTGAERDDANGGSDAFSFGFGDAGNDNNISFFNNNSAADELVNISLMSGSADNFMNMLGGDGSSNDGSAAGVDGGFAGFDFDFGGSGDANGNVFDFGSGGDAAGTSFFNMSQNFNDGTTNDDGGFNFGF